MENTIQQLKLQIQAEALKGIDFILAATIMWYCISFIWISSMPLETKCIYTFITGSVLLPLAYLFSKIFKTNWKIKNNALQPLGLWLNFAQIIYFPLLIFILMYQTEYFIMAYAIITGAHLFPYAWFYDSKWYAIVGTLISISSFFIAVYFQNSISIIPFFTAVSFLILAGLLYVSMKNVPFSNSQECP